MDRSPIYDSVFKTMAEKMPELLVPLVNEAFGTAYPEDAPVTRLGEEHAGKRKRIVDAAFHIECQSSWDPHMAMRMDEYDHEIAHEEAEARGEDRLLVLPASCVVFLRDARSMPDFISVEAMEFDGTTFGHRSRAIWAKQLSADEMFAKHLLILLPFWLMRYEGRFAAIARDSALEEELLAECRDIQERLAEAAADNVPARKHPSGAAEGGSIFRKRMTELIIEVSDHLLRDYVPLQGEVREAMGGKILKFADERYAEAAERHAEEMREAEERCARAEERYAEAEERHAEEMREANARIARELSRHGVDQSIIDQVLSFGRKDGSDGGPSAQQA
ncbi:MAG: hypothetical protein PUC91_09165 [Olsenella sp.]|nr:hypothetical protein [Olsenella sp.]MDD6705527.1 hypothetical protein [Olsenella sp.]